MARIIRRAAKHELDRLAYMCGLLTAAIPSGSKPLALKGNSNGRVHIEHGVRLWPYVQ